MKQYNTQNPANALLLLSKHLNRWIAYGLSLLLIFAYVFTVEAQVVKPQKTKSQHIKQGEIPVGVNQKEWASIQKQMEMSKYKAYPQKDGGYVSANLAHGLQIAYNPQGNTILAPRNTEQTNYQIAMQLESIGYCTLTPLNAPQVLEQQDLGIAKGSKVTYQWSNNLREWWINDEKGLEQWFSLQKAPEGRTANTPLHLRMALQTDMQVTQQGNRLTLQKGNTTLHYDKLKVWDATGKEIQANMHYTKGQLNLYIKDAEATYPLLIDPTWSQQAYLKASNTNASDFFGFLVAISGETIVVGAPGEASNATGINGDGTNNSVPNAGAAYVFVRGTTWTQQAYLKASNTDASDLFGISVAISGETIVVGASGEASNATGINGDGTNNSMSDAGAAYVFVRSGTTWTQQAYLKASNTGADDQFGRSVAISGETVVVGAWREDSNAVGVNGNQGDNSANNAGAAYVFVRVSGVWSQQAYLKASNTDASDRFSMPVTISGETIVVGAVSEASNAVGVNGDQTNNSMSSAGAAYVFVRSGTTWTQQAYLKASNTGASDQFGFSIAISGETIVIGANQEASNATGINGDGTNNSMSGAGAAYVFVRVSGVWSQQAYLKASNTGGSDQFGYSVAISGETVVVGAANEDSNATGINGDDTNNSMSNAGAVYVFVRSGTIWTQQAYLKASNTNASDAFGLSVAISGGIIVVGAYAEASNAVGVNGDQTNNSLSNAGAMYVFILGLPEINLQGNNITIPKGNTITSLNDHTSFGLVNIGANFVRTYTIQNTGTEPLTISSIVSSGANASKFVVGTIPTSIASGSFATFTVTYTPTIGITDNAIITINNNDGDESSYDFAITGIGQTPAEINIQGNAQDILDGAITPSNTNHTDFGLVATTTNTRVFTIRNLGGVALNVSNVTLSGTNANQFAISGLPTLPFNILGNGSQTFTVTFNATSEGIKNATITIANSDSDESSYDFAIRATPQDPAEINLQGALQNIPNGFNAPSFTNHTDFGTAVTTRTFTIQNLGDWPSIINSVTLSGVDANQFTISGLPTLPFNILGNSSQTFVVTFIPTSGGVKNATIIINNNDSDEGSYNFDVRATLSHITVINGNWNNASTWNAGIIPAGVANVTINHTIDLNINYNVGANTLTIQNNKSINIKNGQTLTVPNGGTITNSGILISNVGGNLINNGTINNNGIMHCWEAITNNATLNNNGILNNTKTFANVVGATLINQGIVNNNTNGLLNNNGSFDNNVGVFNNNLGATLGGAGNYTGTLINDGTFSPGNSPGIFTINGTFINNGTVRIEIGGNGGAGVATGHDKLQINGDAILGGTIEAVLINSFVPTNMQIYNTINTTGNVIGTFNTTTLPVSGGGAWLVSYDPTNSNVEYSQALPVTLLEFKGERIQGVNGEQTEEVKLTWKTATEINNKGFEVQKSNNVIDFEKIAFVDGAGNSSVIKDYSLNIQNSDDTYYRLKQIDFDGSFSYSNIIFVKGIENIVNVYPNPTTENINIKTSKEGFVYEIFTLQGNSLIKSTVTSNTANVNIKSFSKGIYFVHIIQNNNRVVKKIVVE